MSPTASVQITITILASLIVGFFESDRTLPTDPGGWKTPKFLGEIVNKIIVEYRNFEGAAALGEEIAKQSQDPILSVLAQINIFNGLRRIPNADSSQLKNMLNQITTEIKKLSKEARTQWLHGICKYNAGIFFQDNNEFREAADAHKEAVAAFKDLGDAPSASISEFMSAFNLLMAAIINGQKEHISDMFSQLESLYSQLLPTMQGHGWEINFHLNMLMVLCLLNDFKTQCWETISRYFEENANSLEQKRPHWWDLFQLAKLVKEGKTSQAIELSQKICEKTDAIRQADTTLTAALVGARMANDDDDDDDDDAYQQALFLGIITNYNGLKGHVPRAIAAREFLPNT